MSEEPQGGSGEWFNTRTDEQLREILAKNSGATPACQIAWAELQRREAKRNERRQLFWIKATLIVSAVLGVAGIVATLLK